jgi:hypothetical protein
MALEGGIRLSSQRLNRVDGQTVESGVFALLVI